MITQARLHELFDYDPATGVLRWKVPTNTRVKAGDEAGTITGKGYRRIMVDGRLYLAHRLAWLCTHGVWPTNDLDHINGRRADNRISNLREATRSENLQNRRHAQSGSRSGLLGASWHGHKGRWRAEIRYNGKRVFLGHFDTAEEAHAAYLQAKEILHPFNTLEAA